MIQPPLGNGIEGIKRTSIGRIVLATVGGCSLGATIGGYLGLSAAYLMNADSVTDWGSVLYNSDVGRCMVAGLITGAAVGGMLGAWIIGRMSTFCRFRTGAVILAVIGFAAGLHLSAKVYIMLQDRPLETSDALAVNKLWLY